MPTLNEVKARLAQRADENVSESRQKAPKRGDTVQYDGKDYRLKEDLDLERPTDWKIVKKNGAPEYIRFEYVAQVEDEDNKTYEMIWYLPDWNWREGDTVKQRSTVLNWKDAKIVGLSGLKNVDKIQANSDATVLNVYHYSSTKFKEFDLSKSDGFWFTTIQPDDEEGREEIGASGADWCALCTIRFKHSMLNGRNYEVEEQLRDSEYDCIENSYDGFTDYALIDPSKIKINAWIHL